MGECKIPAAIPPLLSSSPNLTPPPPPPPSYLSFYLSSSLCSPTFPSSPCPNFLSPEPCVNSCGAPDSLNQDADFAICDQLTRNQGAWHFPTPRTIRAVRSNLELSPSLSGDCDSPTLSFQVSRIFYAIDRWVMARFQSSAISNTTFIVPYDIKIRLVFSFLGGGFEATSRLLGGL